MLTHPHRSCISSEGNFWTSESEMFVGPSLKSSTAPAPFKHETRSNIEDPHENDVLMGRGGKNNQHSGNEKLREFARRRGEDYRCASKKIKSDISRELVRLMRELEPSARFLRKNTETGKWDDVGDDIAREKTSQVLRDAVSEKNGPMTKSKKKPSRDSRRYHMHQLEPYDTAQSTDGSTQHSNPRNYESPVPVESNPRARDVRPDSHGSNRQSYEYTQYMGSFQHPPYSALHSYYPAVTPASSGASAARKRPRVQDTLAFNYLSTPNSSVLTNTQPTAAMSPSYQDQRLMHISPSFYSQTSSRYSSSQQRSPASAMIPSHYGSQVSAVRNEPWLADVHHQPVPRAPPPQHHDFDLYNDDLLSDDDSDHRDGSTSPVDFSVMEV